MAEAPNAKYVAGMVAFVVWYRLSWTSMGLAAFFAALAAKVHYFGSVGEAKFNQKIESAVAGAQKKARRLTVSARAMWSPTSVAKSD